MHPHAAFIALISCNDSNDMCVACVSACLLCSKAPEDRGYKGSAPVNPQGSHKADTLSLPRKCVQNENKQG